MSAGTHTASGTEKFSTSVRCLIATVNCSLSAAASASPAVAATSSQDQVRISGTRRRTPNAPSATYPQMIRRAAGGSSRKELILTRSGPGFRGPHATAPGGATPGVAAPGLGAPGLGLPGGAREDAGGPGLGAPGVPAPGLGAPGVPAPGVPAPGLGVPVSPRPGLRLRLERGHLGGVERRTHDVPLAIQ